MDSGLDGKTAYVTGGASGIGQAVVAALLREGVRVVTADVDASALTERAAEWSTIDASLLAAPIVADLSASAGVAAAVDLAIERLGGVPDLLVNNVGAAQSAPFAEITDEQWQHTFELDFMSAVRTARRIVPVMPQGSAVVNVSSDLAKQPEIVPADYGAMKSALLYVTKALALEFAPAVRVNAVLPGPVWTGLWSRPGGLADQFMTLYGVDTREAAVEEYLRHRQLQLGLSRPEDVADSIVFLLSPRARQINGAALDVGGTIRALT